MEIEYVLCGKFKFDISLPMIVTDDVLEDNDDDMFDNENMEEVNEE